VAFFFCRSFRQITGMATPEPDHPARSEPRSGGVGRMLLFVVFFFGLYVLSPGPVARIYKNRPVPPVLDAFYAPLDYADAHCHAVGKFYDWYIKMWAGR
jgi:hypothetical protein